MTWARLDDTFHHHPKPMDVSLSAVGLFALGLSYAADNLTDGRLPGKWVLGRMVGDDDSAANQLVDAGLWERLGNGAFQIHDFEHYNLTRQEVMSRRDSERDKKRRQRGQPEETDGDSAGSPGTGKGKGTVVGSGKNQNGFEEWLEHYRGITGHTDVRGSKAAKEQFAARLREYSFEDLKLATVGCHGDDFCRDNGHDVPETILRASKVGRYIRLGKSPGKPRSRVDADLARLEAEKQRLRAEEAAA